MQDVTCVWFKRDLRLRDHEPLFEAAARGLVVPVYVFEPELLSQPEHDPAHTQFVLESLRELSPKLSALGAPLRILRGSLPQVLIELQNETGFQTLWSHQETGNALTFQRDLRVADWCQSKGIRFREAKQDGVIRRLKNRDTWESRYKKRMQRPVRPPPPRLKGVAGQVADPIPGLKDLGLKPSRRVEAQKGGERQAHRTLSDFLSHRGESYQWGMSSPLKAWESCSRLSPYLAYGNISAKQVLRASQKKREQIRWEKSSGDSWGKSLWSFEQRLRWRCHFTQKLEDEPEIEFQNMCRAYDGLRENDFQPELFDAFQKAETGYPIVDACLKALSQTGWINFRMRAMLVSFASYHLWTHWRPTGLFLAREFLDFEPGIHWPQHQMQSGTTGINSIRVYSPRKQVLDQDPQGLFLKRWLPELQAVPLEYLAEPHTMPKAMQSKIGCRIGSEYPAPIVSHEEATKRAKDKIFGLRKLPETEAAAAIVLEKHGSRRRHPSGRRSRKKGKK